jgi:uncharacterized membrane protein
MSTQRNSINLPDEMPKHTRSYSQSNGQSTRDPKRLAHALGWFSLGLGATELLAPRIVAKLAGVNGKHTALIRFYGLRELASGIGILAQKQPTASMWSRVGGDVLDIASLGAAFASPTTKKGRLAFATASVLGVTALDVFCARQLTRDSNADFTTIRVNRSVVMNRSAKDLYQFWRNFENLPQFMQHLESVEIIDERRSRWVAKAPAGTTVQWEAEIVEDEPSELIAWRSVKNSDVENSGFVLFEEAPAGRGTFVSVALEYRPPGGVVGAAIAKLFGEEPSQQLATDLRRFKQLIETGEVVLSDSTIHGVGLTEQRAAQPPPDELSGAKKTDVDAPQVRHAAGSN